MIFLMVEQGSSALDWGTVLSSVVSLVIGAGLSWLGMKARLKAERNESRQTERDHRLALLRALLAEITENIEAHGGDHFIPYRRTVWDQAMGVLDPATMKKVSDAIGAATEYNAMESDPYDAATYKKVVQSKLGIARKALTKVIESEPKV